MSDKPWIKDSVNQTASQEPGVKDLFKSASVVINGVPVVLYDTPDNTDSSIPIAETAEPTLMTLTPTQEAGIASSAAAADSIEEREVGLDGVGEVPPQNGEEGTADPTTPAPAEVSGAVAGSNEYAKLCTLINNSLAEASRGLWKETGTNGKIIGCYKTVGFSLSSDSTPWCAAFAGTMMKIAGIPAKKTLSSLDYKTHGTSVPVNDQSQWRLNDILIFSRKGGGHIGFYRGKTASGRIAVAGGNQSDNLTQVGFKTSGSLNLIAVRRAWTLTPEQDKPISGTAPSSGAGGKVT